MITLTHAAGLRRAAARGVIVGVVLACAGWPAVAPASATVFDPPSADQLVATATLGASIPVGAGVGALSFDRVAISGPTVVAHASHQFSWVAAPETWVYVFTEPAAGWSSEQPAAQLIASTGEELSTMAIAGDNVFVDAPEIGANGPGVVYVFTKPAAGWSGVVHETATLTTADAKPGTTLGSSLAASGRTVVATGAGGVYVFTEPPGGWSGAVHESARLTASDGSSLGPVAVSGQAVVAGSSGAAVGANSLQGGAYVFTEPPGGWSGTVHESARLIVSDASANGQVGVNVAVSGSTVVVGSAAPVLKTGKFALYVFGEPGRGWHGDVHQRAERTIYAGDQDLGPDVGVSGQTVATLTSGPTAHECPCAGALDALSEPQSGWRGTLGISPSASASVATAGVPGEIAIDGQTLVAGAEDGVHVFTVLAPPLFSHVSIGGLAAGAPRLEFRTVAGAGAPPLKSVAVKLPHGLRFATTLRMVARGVGVSGAARPALGLSHGELIVTLKEPVRGFSVTIADHALIEGATLLRTARAIDMTRARAKTLRVRLVVSTTDSAGDSTPVAMTIRGV